MKYEVDADIASAHTLPGSFYSDREAFARCREKVFARSWQWLGNLADVGAPQSLSPRDLLPGLLDEPLLLARDASGSLRCLSNVCTHRGNILVKGPCAAKEIRCGYHSRRFDLAGRMTFMPEFNGAKDFPSPSDDLPRVEFREWAGHGFASLDPMAAFDEFFDRVSQSVQGRAESLAHDPSRDRDYELHASWALYVENYLEGFHIPFVHAGLDEAVDYGTYRTEIHRYSNVQLAATRDGEPAAQYWWIFPNLMLNFISLGIVAEPGRAPRHRSHSRALPLLRGRRLEARRGRGRVARSRGSRGRGHRACCPAWRALAPLHPRPLLAHAGARRAPFPPPALRGARLKHAPNL